MLQNGPFDKKARPQRPTVCHIHCISSYPYQFEGTSQCLLAFLLFLHLMGLLRRPVCFSPIFFYKVQLLTICLSSVFTQSLTWVSVCQLWWTQRCTGQGPLRGRTSCPAVGRSQQTASRCRHFRMCISCKEPFHLRSCSYGWSTSDDWARPWMPLRMTLKSSSPPTAPFCSIFCFSFIDINPQWTP